MSRCCYNLEVYEICYILLYSDTLRRELLIFLIYFINRNKNTFKDCNGARVRQKNKPAKYFIDYFLIEIKKNGIIPIIAKTTDILNMTSVVSFPSEVIKISLKNNPNNPIKPIKPITHPVE